MKKRMSKLEEVQDGLKSILDKRDRMIVKVQETQKQVEERMKEFYELSPDYVKIECPNCLGKGMGKNEEGKNVLCPSCRGECFIWAKIYKPNIEKKKT